jgi:hypothetical protein
MMLGGFVNVLRLKLSHSATVGGRVASPTAVPEPGLK